MSIHLSPADATVAATPASYDAWTVARPGDWGSTLGSRSPERSFMAWYPTFADLARALGVPGAADAAALRAARPDVDWIGSFDGLCFDRDAAAQAIRADFYVGSVACLHTPIEDEDVRLFAEYLYAAVG